VEESKNSIREACRSACRALTPEERQRANMALSRRLLVLPEVASATTVLAYAAMPEEADPADAVRALGERAVRIAWPRVSGDGVLSLHAADAGRLLPGFRGILEPPEDAPLVDPAEVDVAFVPGSAFDAGCQRIGKGGGFYDRLLPALRGDALKVGIAFDEQVVDEVPVQPHDVALDAIVTPTRTFVRGR
jgi:5-formyltetrahydrofolate cyclo-ligase